MSEPTVSDARYHERGERRVERWRRSLPAWALSLGLHGVLLTLLAAVTWTSFQPEPPEIVVELRPVTEGGATGPPGASAATASEAPAESHAPMQATAARPLPAPPLPQASPLPAPPLPQETAMLASSDPALALLAERATAAVDALTGPGGGMLEGTSDGFQSLVGQMRRRGLDIVFVLDATESMSPYIEQAKRRLHAVVEVVHGLLDTGQRRRPNWSPVRYGVVAFKDYGDEYGPDAVRTLSLTEDREQLVKFLNETIAGGGGDEPEPIHRALAAAADEAMGWARPRRAVVILIGDAPVHSLGRMVAMRIARQFPEHRAQLNVIDVGGATGDERAREDVLSDFARLAEAAKGSAFLLQDEQAFWRHLIVSIFGHEYEHDVEQIIETFVQER